MKDNTLFLVGAGAIAIFFLMKKRQAVLPAGTITPGPLSVAPYNQQQGLLLPFLNNVVNSVTAIAKGAPVPSASLVTAPNGSAYNPATGVAYNADGSVDYASTQQIAQTAQTNAANDAALAQQEAQNYMPVDLLAPADSGVYSTSFYSGD